MPSSVQSPATAPAQRVADSAWLTVLIAGLIAGALDLTFAFVFYHSQGVTPDRILRGIAAGVLGLGARDMGPWVSFLGAALHFFISVCAAFVYYLVSRRVPLLTRRPLLCGALFGVAMFAVMRFIVIPLSRLPFHVPSLHNTIGELCSHIFLFGMVIALGVARVRRH